MNSMPVMTGMFQSSSTTSGMLSRHLLRPSWPIFGFIYGEAECFQDVARHFPDHARVVDDKTGFHFSDSLICLAFLMLGGNQSLKLLLEEVRIPVG